MREPFSYNNPEHSTKQIIRYNRTWFYFPRWKLSLLTPAKCGSSSVKQFIWMNEIEDEIKRIHHHEVTGEIFSTVREPVSRFCSLWKSKARDKANLRDTGIYGMSPDELMTHIESGRKDVHWTPQSNMLVNLDVTLIPLPTFSDWWSQRGYGELGKYNATEGEIEISNDLRERILTFYADDVILYNRANEIRCL